MPDSKPRLWLSDTAQLLGVLSLMSPVIGFIGRGLRLALVPGRIPVHLVLQSDDIRTLAVEGAAWLLLVLAMAGLIATPAYVIIRWQRKNPDRGPVDPRLFRWVLPLASLAGLALWAPFLPWHAVLAGTSVMLAGGFVLGRRTRNHPLRASHLWPLVPLGICGALVVGVLGGTIGTPGHYTFSAGSSNGLYSALGRDDVFSYLWPCDSGDRRVLAVPTGSIESVLILPDALTFSTVLDLIRGDAGLIRPTIDCGPHSP